MNRKHIHELREVGDGRIHLGRVRFVLARGPSISQADPFLRPNEVSLEFSGVSLLHHQAREAIIQRDDLGDQLEAGVFGKNGVDLVTSLQRIMRRPLESGSHLDEMLSLTSRRVTRRTQIVQCFAAVGEPPHYLGLLLRQLLLCEASEQLLKLVPQGIHPGAAFLHDCGPLRLLEERLLLLLALGQCQSVLVSATVGDDKVTQLGAFAANQLEDGLVDCLLADEVGLGEHADRPLTLGIGCLRELENTLRCAVGEARHDGKDAIRRSASDFRWASFATLAAGGRGGAAELTWYAHCSCSRGPKSRPSACRSLWCGLHISVRAWNKAQEGRTCLPR